MDLFGNFEHKQKQKQTNLTRIAAKLKLKNIRNTVTHCTVLALTLSHTLYSRRAYTDINR